ncbi:hypothetical protein J4402_01405 [Candidatus Pacearchaeota archaeon]|nr:hypothetical protein [Candidatus Pacearchaeota archaeon]
MDRRTEEQLRERADDILYLFGSGIHDDQDSAILERMCRDSRRLRRLVCDKKLRNQNYNAYISALKYQLDEYERKWKIERE